MSTPYGQFTPHMNTYIQRKLKYVTYTQSKLYRWFQMMPGLIKPVPRGLKKHNSTILQKAEYGNFVEQVSEFKANTPRFLEVDSELAMLGTKLEIPFNDLDRWTNNQLVDMSMNDYLANVMRSITQQIDGFLAWGDASKFYDPFDFLANEGIHTGLFNSGTAFGAGIGGDDDVAAAGDYLASYSTATLALKNAGYECESKATGNDGYWMFSDSNTAHAAELGSNIISTYDFITEKDQLMAKKRESGGLRDWIDSPNMLNRSGTYYMTITKPYKTTPMIGAKDNEIATAYRLLQGYDFEVRPLNAGGLNDNGAYSWIVLWSGALEVDDATSIQNSGSLTLA